MGEPWTLQEGLQSTYLFVPNTCPLKSMTKALTCLISSFSISTNCSTVSRSASTSSPKPMRKVIAFFALDLLYVAWCVNYGHRFSFITVPSDLSIRLLLDLEGNFASFLTFPPQHRSFWSHPEFPPRQQSIGCHQSSPHP